MVDRRQTRWRRRGPPATATATGRKRVEALIATAMDKKAGKRVRDVGEQEVLVHGDSDAEEGQVTDTDDECSDSDVEE